MNCLSLWVSRPPCRRADRRALSLATYNFRDA